MISSRKLINMASKWMKSAGIVRKRISFHGKVEETPSSMLETTSTSKGHFAVYTNDGNRFMVPLKWLNNDFFVELLKKAEETFGFRGDGPIVLPFDSSLMEDVAKYLKGLLSHELSEELLESVRRRPCSLSSTSIEHMQQLLVC